MAAKRLTTYVQELIHRQGPRGRPGPPQKKQATDPMLSAARRPRGESEWDPTDPRRP